MSGKHHATGMHTIIFAGLALLSGCIAPSDPGPEEEGWDSSETNTSTNRASLPELAFPGQHGEVLTGLVKLPGLGLQEVIYERFGDTAVIQGDILVEEAAGDERAAGSLELEYGSGPSYATGRFLDSLRWPGGIVPYTVDPALPDVARVEDAIAHWEESTLIRFKARTSETDYVTFRRGSGCSSYVGRVGGQQFVTLADGCSTGSTIHEIGHTVGLWHEQSRADRDDSITIHFANIQEGSNHNFSTYVDKGNDGVDLGPYDFGSIMHYDSYAFSANGSPTITKKDGTTFNAQRDGLSGGDVRAVETMYGRRTRLHSDVTWNRCLKVADSNTANGTGVQIWTCNGTSAQEWILTPSGELRSRLAPNRCLDVAGSGTANGTKVQIYSCNGSNAQKWTMTTSGELRSAVAANRCLAVANGGTAKGTKVHLWTCNGTSAQKWTDYVAVQSDLSWDRCLDVANGGTADGTNVQIYSCNGSKAQQWLLTSSGELRSAVAAGRCLNVANGGTASGTNVQIYSCNGSDAQKWTWTSQGKLRSALGSNLCLDVSGGSSALGTNVKIATCTGERSQRWLKPGPK